MTWKQASLVSAMGLALVASAWYLFGLVSPFAEGRLAVPLSMLGAGLGLAGTGLLALFFGKVWTGRDDIFGSFLVCLFWAGSASLVASAWIPIGPPYYDLPSALMAGKAGFAGFFLGLGFWFIPMGFVGRVLLGLWRAR